MGLAAGRGHDVGRAAAPAERGLQGKPVYVIGERALVDALAAPPASVRPGGPDDAGKTKADLQAEQFPIASLALPAAEVAAAASRDGAANYHKIARAAYPWATRRLFVATTPTPRSRRARRGAAPATPPAAGVGARRRDDERREPDLMCGKPSASLNGHMVERFGRPCARHGRHRLDTDIEFGTPRGRDVASNRRGEGLAASRRAERSGPLHRPSIAPRRHPSAAAPALCRGAELRPTGRRTRSFHDRDVCYPIVYTASG